MLSTYYVQGTVPRARDRNKIQAFLNEKDKRYTRLQHSSQVSSPKDDGKGMEREGEGAAG